MSSVSPVLCSFAPFCTPSTLSRTPVPGRKVYPPGYGRCTHRGMGGVPTMGAGVLYTHHGSRSAVYPPWCTGLGYPPWCTGLGYPPWYWAWYTHHGTGPGIHTLAYTPYTHSGYTIPPPYTRVHRHLQTQCGLTHLWAQAGNNAWVRASRRAKVSQSVTVLRVLCAEF